MLNQKYLVQNIEIEPKVISYHDLFGSYENYRYGKNKTWTGYWKYNADLGKYNYFCSGIGVILKNGIMKWKI